MKTPMEALMGEIPWELIEAQPTAANGDLPHATHQGIFLFSGQKIRCYRLSNGEAIFDADDFQDVFGEILGVLEHK